MQPVLIHHEDTTINSFHFILFTIFYRNRTNNLFTMTRFVFFVLTIICLVSCKKENHAYKISYNVSPTHYISGTNILVVATHYNVYCEQLTTDEESCLLKQDSQTVSTNNPEAFNFKVEYLGTNTDFSNPENFECK